MGGFTITDHVGSVVRLLLLVVVVRGWPLRSVDSLALYRWIMVFVLAAFEVCSWMMRLATPPGRRLALSSGTCHVLEEAPSTEGVRGVPPVLLVHGFAGSHMYFDGLASALRAHGRTVIRHDNWGRGFSSSGAGPLTAELFVQQVKEVLDQLGLEKVDLVGYSMGGAISIAFSAAYPERLRHLVLLAPAGMKSCNQIPPAVSLLTRVPGIDLLLGCLLVRNVVSKKSYGVQWELTAAGSQARLDELHAKEVRRLPIEGFRFPHALGRTLARFPMGGLTEEARSFGMGYETGRHKVRTLGVFGPADSLVPFKGMDELKELVPHMETHVFQTAKHGFPLERPEETADVLMHFWKD